MKIMIVTDSPLAGTGFGEEMRQIAFRLAQKGHKIYYVGLSYSGYPIQLIDKQFSDLPHKGAKITLLSQGPYVTTEYGATAVYHYYKIYYPDIVLFMGDPRNILPYEKIKETLGVPLFFYVTLDGTPVPPQFKRLLSIPDINITITEWAMKEYQKHEIPIHAYIHHGINWRYWQRTQKQKQQLRRKYGIKPNEVIFITWDNNQHRKRMDALLRCWKRFITRVKTGARLILFTDWNCELGWNLEHLIKLYQIPRNTILSPKDLTGRRKTWAVLPEEPQILREIASLGDIYVSTTSGEGFGKCLLEAMALGQVVIATDYSAVPEVLGKNEPNGPYGCLIPIKGTFRWHDKVRSVEGGLVDEEAFVEAMIYFYSNPKTRKYLGSQARKWAKNFDYKLIVEGWENLFRQINPDVLLASHLLSM